MIPAGCIDVAAAEREPRMRGDDPSFVFVEWDWQL